MRISRPASSPSTRVSRPLRRGAGPTSPRPRPTHRPRGAAEKSGAARRAYNERTRQCDGARRLVAARLGRREDISYPALLAAAPVEELLLVAEAALSGVLARRFRHVVTEGTRVPQAEAAMAAGDLAAFGRLLDASHQSLPDDYAVSHPALDRLVELAREAGAVGARLTGAGFGGSIVALCRGAP